MFTLQILDRGQTSLHPLDERPVTLGSAANVDIRLEEVGVEARHATIRAADGGFRLEAHATTHVNGERIERCDLRLGDRIELGRAVLVVGRTVARSASPEDVIAEAPSRLRRSPAKKRQPWLPIAAALAVAGLVTWFALQGDDGAGVRIELRNIARLRQDAQLDRAAAEIARLRGEWAKAGDDRLALLDRERTALAAIETTEARLRSAVLDPADTRTYNEWHRELQRLEAEGTAEERVAAHVLRGNLRDTIERRPQPVAPRADTNPAANVVATHVVDNHAVPPPGASSNRGATLLPDVAPALSTPAASTAQVAPAAATPDAWRASLAEAERLRAAGEFAQALAVLQGTSTEAADAGAAGELRQHMDALRAAALTALQPLLQQARERLDAGNAAAALSLLEIAQPHFPASAEFAALADELHRAETAVAAGKQPVRGAVGNAPVDEAVRTATLASLRAQMDQIRAAEEKSAFGDAKALLASAATAVRDRDPDFAQRLDARAAEAGLIAAFQAEVATALRANRKLETMTDAGMRVTLRAADGGELSGTSTGGEQHFTWQELGAAGIDEIATQLAVTGDAALGAASLLYKRGETALAERVLAKVEHADVEVKPAVDRVIARGRGEPLDPRGYTLGKDGFVSVRATAVQTDAKKLAARLESVLRERNPAAREAFTTDVLASGPDGAKVLAAAFKKEFERQVAKLDTGSLRKQVEHLAAQRQLLDKARRFAKDLIFDEVKYFYPYKPPAVSGEKFAEYNRVQAEVDNRVAALRTLWQDDRLRVKVPTSLRQDLDRLDWVAKVLADLGELDAAALASIDWVRALPPGDSVTIRDYCETPTERAEIDEWRTVEAYNTIIGKQLSSAQRELLRITNDYRAMFRHRPLAIVPTCCDASQGHADEMSKLGYFAHMSPTPGRETPFDRMRLAGYMFGVSENIALVDGALGAHVAWCHSSGHHRNLLDPSHTEIGIGCAGRDWVQNFGAGKVHCEESAWQQAKNLRKD